MSEIEPQYLNTRDAARYTGISVGTLNRHRLLRLEPPFVKVGSLVRYRKQDLDTFMAKHVVKVRAE